jgi:hypothetical protein
MLRKNKNYYIRKVHRYLGIVLGIQFLMWTIGGLYFSWNDIDKVHGDHLRKQGISACHFKLDFAPDGCGKTAIRIPG